MMNYYIDFEGYCVIEAENVDDARMKFWQVVQRNEALPCNVYEITGVEKGDC